MRAAANTADCGQALLAGEAGAGSFHNLQPPSTALHRFARSLPLAHPPLTSLCPLRSDAAVMDSFSVKYWRSSTPNASHLSISPDLNQYSVSIVYPDAATSAGAAVQPYRALIDPAIADWALSTERGPLFEKWAPSGGGGGGGSSEVLEWEMVRRPPRRALSGDGRKCLTPLA